MAAREKRLFNKYLIFPSQTHRRQRKLDLRLSFNHYILKPIFVSSVKHLDTIGPFIRGKIRRVLHKTHLK